MSHLVKHIELAELAVIWSKMVKSMNQLKRRKRTKVKRQSSSLEELFNQLENSILNTRTSFKKNFSKLTLNQIESRLEKYLDRSPTPLDCACAYVTIFRETLPKITDDCRKPDKKSGHYVPLTLNVKGLSIAERDQRFLQIVKKHIANWLPNMLSTSLEGIESRRNSNQSQHWTVKAKNLIKQQEAETKINPKLTEVICQYVADFILDRYTSRSHKVGQRELSLDLAADLYCVSKVQLEKMVPHKKGLSSEKASLEIAIENQEILKKLDYILLRISGHGPVSLKEVLSLGTEKSQYNSPGKTKEKVSLIK